MAIQSEGSEQQSNGNHTYQKTAIKVYNKSS